MSFSGIRMHCARLKYQKTKEEKTKQERKMKKATWKPVLDRKRTSPGSRRSRRKRVKSGSTGLSDMSSGLSSEGSSLSNSYEQAAQEGVSVFTQSQLTISTENIENQMSRFQFQTSTPTVHGRSVLRAKDFVNSSGNTQESLGVAKGTSLLPNGRPNFRKTPENRYRLRQKKSSETEHIQGDCSPLKKRRTNLGSERTLEDLSVREGIVSRRKLPAVSGLHIVC